MQYTELPSPILIKCPLCKGLGHLYDGSIAVCADLQKIMGLKASTPCSICAGTGKVRWLQYNA